ncbi:hypothetical protein CN189_14445 [Sinorhizobium meliloti]|nr:hypothetical protein CN189_14445 [Sinorhizobium meliloti]
MAAWSVLHARHGHETGDLKLRPSPVRELNEAGYELVDDVQYLPTAELLRLPEMGGRGSRSSPGRRPA